MKREILLYGLAKGETERYMERLLSTQCKSAKDIKRVKDAAAKDGYHSFRTATFDGGPPDFTKVIQTSGTTWGVKQVKRDGSSRWYTNERHSKEDAIALARSYNSSSSIDPLSNEPVTYRAELIGKYENY